MPYSAPRNLMAQFRSEQLPETTSGMPMKDRRNSAMHGRAARIEQAILQRAACVDLFAGIFISSCFNPGIAAGDKNTSASGQSPDRPARHRTVRFGKKGVSAMGKLACFSQHPDVRVVRPEGRVSSISQRLGPGFTHFRQPPERRPGIDFDRLTTGEPHPAEECSIGHGHQFGPSIQREMKARRPAPTDPAAVPGPVGRLTIQREEQVRHG